MGKSKIIIIVLLVLFSSCGEKKTEFIESNTMDLILIKNIPNDRTALRKQIKEFIINEKIEKSVDFYEYKFHKRDYHKKDTIDLGIIYFEDLENFDDEEP